MIHSAKACFTAAVAMIRPSLTEARAERAGGIWALGNKFKTRFCRNMILHNNGRPHGVAPTALNNITIHTIRDIGQHFCIGKVKQATNS